MYLQIMDQVRRRVAVGDWPPGQELPSIRALAASIQVSVITVKRAYLELEREGVIVTRQGRGIVRRRQRRAQRAAAAPGAGRPPRCRRGGRTAARAHRGRDRGAPPRGASRKKTRRTYDRARHRALRRGEGVPVLPALGGEPAPGAGPDHGLRRPERRRQVDDHPDADGHAAAGSRRDPDSGTVDAARTGGGEARHRFRLGGHAPLRRRHAGLAHALRRVHPPGLGSGLRGRAARAASTSTPIRPSRRSRTASA